ncbi:hypothetical protein LOD99_2723 [Oopsacas minuta]|uniref:Energy transducer TonB n=1 Tax=Oopsacas minuta TaxID=111878 RepID=A0AAV7K2Q0_9METZ|nr:hypothetical protein LOD99_2723 [Oopsacas minuta]
MGNYIKKIKRPRPRKIIDEYEEGELLFNPYWLRNRKAFIAVKTVVVVTVTVYYLLFANTDNFGPEPTILDPIRAKWKELQKKIIAIDPSDERIKSKIEEKSKANETNNSTQNTTNTTNNQEIEEKENK